MSQAYISAELRRRVVEEARSRCGYCLTSQTIVAVPMHIEHITPLAAGGRTVVENLWLACPLCNGYKGVQTHASDPETGEQVPLFGEPVVDLG
jgi:5-methylcytosine-specific restriction endonuclease McrA